MWEQCPAKDKYLGCLYVGLSQPVLKDDQKACVKNQGRGVCVGVYKAGWG